MLNYNHDTWWILIFVGGCGQLGNWRRKVYSYFHSTKPSATWCNIPRVQKGNSMMIFAYVFTVEPRLRHVVYTMFLLTYSWPTRTSQTQSTPKWMVTYKRHLWQLVWKQEKSVQFVDRYVLTIALACSVCIAEILIHPSRAKSRKLQTCTMLSSFCGCVI